MLLVTTLVRLRAHERSVHGSCRGGWYRRFANCCSSLLSVRSTWSLEKVLREAQQQHDALQELQQEANSSTEPRPLVATGGQAPLGSTQPSAIDVAPASLNLDTIPAPHHHKRDRLPMSVEDDDSE